MCRSLKLSPRSLGKHLCGGSKQSNSRDPAWKHKGNPPKTNQAKPSKVLLGSSVRRMLVPGRVGADHRRALLWVSNLFYLRTWFFQAKRKTVCQWLIRVTGNCWINNHFLGVCVCYGLKSSAGHCVSIWKLLWRVWSVVCNLTSSLVLLFSFLEQQLHNLKGN